MKNLMASIFKVQQSIGIIGKDANNPYFKSKYATLEHVWELVKPKLADAGLCVVQPAIFGPEGAGCKTLIVHLESGESMETSLLLPLPEKGAGAQGVGSCISYARRYSLTAALGLVVGDEDDDGEASLGRSKNGQKSAPTPANKGSPVAAPAPAPAAPAKVSPKEATQQKLAEAAKPVETPKESTVAPVTITPKERKLAVFSYLKSDGSFSEEDIRDAVAKVLGRKVNPTGDVLLKSIVELEKLELWVSKLKAMTSGTIADWMRANPGM